MVPYRTVLGAGGRGQVDQARDPSLERREALKVLRPGSNREIGALERFHREASALAQLKPPHVWQTHEWMETPCWYLHRHGVRARQDA
jgi:serine/threonine protein kinase